MDGFQQVVQDSFGNLRQIQIALVFSFSKLFCILFLLGISNLFAGLQENHKVIRERISALNFVMEHISDFKLGIKINAIYNYQMDIIEQATLQQKPEIYPEF